MQPREQTERQVWSYEKATVSSVSSEKRLFDSNKSGRVSQPIKVEARVHRLGWDRGWKGHIELSEVTKRKFGVDTDMNTDGTSAITNISLH